MAGVVVTAVGSDRWASTDGTGRFMLTDVPDGTSGLRFRSPGVDAALAIDGVRQGQTIELFVTLAGATATLSSERRSSGAEEEVEGVVESVGTGGRFVVSGRAVSADAGTVFRQGASVVSIAALAVGQRVRVKGRMSGGVLLATDVGIRAADDDGRDEGEVELTGTIANLTGNEFSFSFFIGTAEFRGDATTVFVEASGFAGLRNGLLVEVKGVQQTGFVRLTRVHREDDDDGGRVQPAATLTSIDGSGTELTLVVGGTTVTTTAATEVRRRGDAVPIGVLQIGMVLEVEGSSTATGIAARKLTIESDTHDADFEGVVAGAVTGGCPAIRFTVGSRIIETIGSTEFKDMTCGAVVAGVPLKVRGVVHPAGHVVATRVERED